jgi:hypothetical protein
MQCERCDGTGVCPTSKGTGHSGYFLRQPPPWAPKCWRCDGTARCEMCEGSGEVADYNPWITVLTSLTRPTSISVAAFTGATWRFLDIPKWILQRSHDQQRGRVSWRVRTHYKVEDGQCSLFGAITSYRWHSAPEQSIEFGPRGRTRRPTASSREGVASLQYKGKTLAISQRGRIAIEATGPNDS